MSGKPAKKQITIGNVLKMLLNTWKLDPAYYLVLIFLSPLQQIPS